MTTSTPSATVTDDLFEAELFKLEALLQPLAKSYEMFETEEFDMDVIDKACADIARILEEETERGAFPFVLHCFTSGPELARRGLALGGYISFSGVLTFKKAEALREIAKEAPLDRLLVETDAPYLAPEPMRGKTNEPANVVHTAAKLAAVKAIGEDELARATTENFFRLFNKVPRSAVKAPASAA